MALASRSRPVPYYFDDLPLLTREEVVLWNWYCRVGPGQAEWRSWAADIFGHLVERQAGVEVQLFQTHLVDTQLEEKRLSLGSKQELSLGSDADNDIVLAAKSIGGHHARLSVREGKLYLEDLGSRLGTYLWDKRIESKGTREIKSGDQFTVFPYRFRALLEQTWTPETDVRLSECQTWTISQGEFFQSSPYGWTAFFLHTHPGGEPAVLQVNPAFLSELQRRILAPMALQAGAGGIPSDNSLAEFIILALIERLNQSLKFAVQFSVRTRLQSKPMGAARGMLASFALGVGGLTGQFRLFLPGDFFGSCKPELPRQLSASLPAQLSWNFPVSAGYVDFSAQEIAQVAPGDILVAQPAVAILFPNDFRRGWAGTPEGSNFTGFRVDKYFERGVSLGTASEPLGSALRPDVESLPVQLQVVVGERELTLADIQSLGPGTVVELGAAKTDPVRLMVNGKVLGEGELVEVEGKLGVRVLGWRK